MGLILLILLLGVYYIAAVCVCVCVCVCRCVCACVHAGVCVCVHEGDRLRIMQPIQKPGAVHASQVPVIRTSEHWENLILYLIGRAVMACTDGLPS